MKILVLLAGVADIRFPLHPIALGEDGAIDEQGTPRRLLSPFDEAALEVALKLRDSRPETQVDVVLLDGGNSENLLRTIAALRPDSVRCAALQPCRPWDARLTAEQLAGLVRRDYPQHPLLLVGRELGDLDDGSIAVLLARRLGWPQLSMAQYGQWQEDQLLLLRERGNCEETLKVEPPLLVSVTNDKRNKLRYPIMKNVMQAKRMAFTYVSAPAVAGEGLDLRQLEAAPVVSREGECQMLEGTVVQQAQALVAWLHAQGVKP